MAIENNYGGPPSLEIYQEFVRSVDTAAVDQNAVVVAQHFDVFKAADAATKDYQEYSAGIMSSVTWTELGSSNEKVDKESVNVVFKDAYVIQSEVTGTVTGNVITLDTDVDDPTIPEPVFVGDKVLVNDTVAEIVSIRRSANTAITPTATLINSVTSGISAGFKVGGSYTGANSRIYYLHIEDVITPDNSNSGDGFETVTGNIVKIKVTTADGTDGGYCEIHDDEVVRMANSGLTLSVSSWGFEVGSYYQVEAKPEGIGVRNVLYIDKNISGTSVIVGLGKSKSFDLPSSKYVVTDEGVQLSDVTADIQMGDSTIYNAKVITGKFFVEFRAISTKFVNRLGYITGNNISEVGYTGVENPLGAMVKTALKGGRGVYCVGVTDDSVEAYRKAFVLLSRSTNTYGVVIGSLRPDVITEAHNFVTAQADPSVANYKIVYYGLDDTQESAVVAINKGGDRLLATITDGEVVFTNSDDATGFMLKGVESGDTFRVNYSTDAYGNVSFEEFVVDYVKNDTTLVLTNTNITTPVAKVFEIYRTLTGSDLINALKSRVYTKSHRCYCVFGDGINIDGINDAPAWLKAALPAGMRAGEYCQRPISNMEYAGCTATNKLSLNAAELKDLASRGVWILANNADGESVYNYHQLSTDMSDKKLQEQSYTTNYDSISRSARSLMSPYYGNSNISDDFIKQIYANLVALLGGFTTNAPTTEIGPQLLRYENLNLIQDPVNKDHLYMEVDYDMPAPFNHVTMRQRLI